VWFTRDQINSMTAAQRLSRIGNRTAACRILAEKAEEGDYFGEYFGNPGLQVKFNPYPANVENMVCS